MLVKGANALRRGLERADHGRAGALARRRRSRPPRREGGHVDAVERLREVAHGRVATGAHLVQHAPDNLFGTQILAERGADTARTLAGNAALSTVNRPRPASSAARPSAAVANRLITPDAMAPSIANQPAHRAAPETT